MSHAEICRATRGCMRDVITCKKTSNLQRNNVVRPIKLH